MSYNCEEYYTFHNIIYPTPCLSAYKSLKAETFVAADEISFIAHYL